MVYLALLLLTPKQGIDPGSTLPVDRPAWLLWPLLKVGAVMLYATLALRVLSHGNAESGKTQWFRHAVVAVLIVFAVLLVLLVFAPGNVPVGWIDSVYAVATALTVMGIGFNAFRASTAWQIDRPVRRVGPRPRDAGIGAALDHLMNEEAIYLQADLTLPDLAAATGYSLHEVSAYLNQVVGKNFYRFINEARVHAACRRLIAEPRQPVLAIAHEVGFNNKATFNNAFRRITGTTPSRFRATHAKKVHASTPSP